MSTSYKPWTTSFGTTTEITVCMIELNSEGLANPDRRPGTLHDELLSVCLLLDEVRELANQVRLLYVNERMVAGSNLGVRLENGMTRGKLQKIGMNIECAQHPKCLLHIRQST